ncbi:SGNH hydrolase-type esterase domain-containing protein [Leptodontidium sp. 2 PMI_412]|nr:SGNH hydrolase-type esterase domain-containing protein [Leptodontidium sp. 2 PMI_412]
MRVSPFICSVGVLAVTVSSSPARWFNPQWLEGRSSDAATPVNARANPQLRIMVAGASIASGYASSDGNGFRLGLEDALVAAGNNVEMLGTVRNGTMRDNAYEAKPGLHILEVMGRVDAAIPQISPRPNIVLVQVGANDLAKGTSVDTMQQRISTLVDHVCTAIPDVNVILSSLLPSGKTESGGVAYNAKLREVVDAQNKQGRHVYFADVHSSFSMEDILGGGDLTHPTDAGYAKMARVYADVALGIVKARFAPPPAPSTSSAAPETTSTSVPEPEPTKSSTSSETPRTTSTPVSDTTTETTSSSQPQRQVASATSVSATMSTSTQEPSSTTVANLAASTSSPASTPSSSAPAKSSANTLFGQCSVLITAIGMLAWTIPLFAI